MNGKAPATALALFAALQSVFSDLHPYCDQVLQHGDDAIKKDKPGAEGRSACARHVLSYSIGQLGGAYGVTRLLGYRTPVAALAAGTAINAVTHYVIDRREPLKRFVRSPWMQKLRLVGVGKAGYLEHATAQRRPGVVDDGGPGTALMELDQAVHRAISIAASLTTTLIAVRWATK